MGVGGRTATLVALTAVAGALAAWLARRGLRAAAESLVPRGLRPAHPRRGRCRQRGLVRRPVVGRAARAGRGGPRCGRCRRRPRRTADADRAAHRRGGRPGHRHRSRLRGGRAGELAAPSPSLVVATVVAGGVAVAAHLARLTVAAIGAAVVTGAAWMSLTAEALDRAFAQDSWRGLWLDLEVWPLLVAAALVGLVAPGPPRAPAGPGRRRRPRRAPRRGGRGRPGPRAQHHHRRARRDRRAGPGGRCRLGPAAGVAADGCADPGRVRRGPAVRGRRAGGGGRRPPRRPGRRPVVRSRRGPAAAPRRHGAACCVGAPARGLRTAVTLAALAEGSTLVDRAVASVPGLQVSVVALLAGSVVATLALYPVAVWLVVGALLLVAAACTAWSLAGRTDAPLVRPPSSSRRRSWCRCTRPG